MISHYDFVSFIEFISFTVISGLHLIESIIQLEMEVLYSLIKLNAFILSAWFFRRSWGLPSRREKWRIKYQTCACIERLLRQLGRSSGVGLFKSFYAKPLTVFKISGMCQRNRRISNVQTQGQRGPDKQSLR